MVADSVGRTVQWILLGLQSQKYSYFSPASGILLTSPMVSVFKGRHSLWVPSLSYMGSSCDTVHLYYFITASVEK